MILCELHFFKKFVGTLSWSVPRKRRNPFQAAAELLFSVSALCLRVSAHLFRRCGLPIDIDSSLTCTLQAIYTSLIALLWGCGQRCWLFPHLCLFSCCFFCLLLWVAVSYFKVLTPTRSPSWYGAKSTTPWLQFSEHPVCTHEAAFIT